MRFLDKPGVTVFAIKLNLVLNIQTNNSKHIDLRNADELVKHMHRIECFAPFYTTVLNKEHTSANQTMHYTCN